MCNTWLSIHRNLQGVTAPNYDGVGEFTFVGDPRLNDDEFYVNVFNYHTGAVEVLRGDRDLAASCLAARLRYGGRAVYVFTQAGVPRFVECLREALPQLDTCDLERFTHDTH